MKFTLETNAELFKSAEKLGNDFVFGNEYRGPKLNLKKHISSLHKNPIEDLIRTINPEGSYFRDDGARLNEAYLCYLLSLERFLGQMSVSVKVDNKIKYKIRSREKLTDREKVIWEKHKLYNKYLYLDFYNTLMYARILMDRIAVTSKYFLKLKNVPSFTSFNDHKKFFVKNGNILDTHQEYSNKIVNDTKWFDFTLKIVRDKFLVHASPTHQMHFGYPGGEMDDLCMVIIVPDNPKKDMSQVKIINLSLIQLSIDIDIFLKWFNEYGLKSLELNK